MLVADGSDRAGVIKYSGPVAVRALIRRAMIVAFLPSLCKRDHGCYCRTAPRYDSGRCLAPGVCSHTMTRALRTRTRSSQTWQWSGSSWIRPMWVSTAARSRARSIFAARRTVASSWHITKSRSCLRTRKAWPRHPAYRPPQQGPNHGQTRPGAQGGALPPPARPAYSLFAPTACQQPAVRSQAVVPFGCARPHLPPSH